MGGMGSETFWSWIMWAHLAFLALPVAIACVKIELDDLRRFRPTHVTHGEHEMSEQHPAA